MEIPFLGISVWTIAKAMLSFALLLYTIFAAVVVRQVQLMTDTLEVGLETPIKLLAMAHLLLSVGVFILALIIL